ncbi:MAG TPA: Holliday junction resolvase RuvX [Candidatus Saccharimonadales bacterium]
MSQSKKYLGLDIGEVRVGVAVADDAVKIAVPYDTIRMDESSFRKDIAELVTSQNVTTIVVGYPRNQSGDSTAQTEYVLRIAELLEDMDAVVVFQDESLTSVLAEERIKSRGDEMTKEAIDAEAASIILQDYLEMHT